MSDDGSAQSSSTWPLVKFYFQLQWNSYTILFQEVTGLSETQVIQTRTGHGIVLPDTQKRATVALKKGIFKGDPTQLAIFNDEIKRKAIQPSNLVISLWDENNIVTMAWKLINVSFSKIAFTDMKSEANEIAIETMELAYETLQIDQ